MRSQALQQALQARGAVFQDREGVQTVAHYGDLEQELDRAAEAGGLREQSHRRRLIALGKDRVEFLNGQCTNEVKDVSDTRTLTAVFTTPKGRVVDHVQLFQHGDGIGLLGTERPAADLLELLDRKVVMEDVQLRDAGEELGSLQVFGPACRAAVEQVFGACPAEQAPPHAATTGDFDGQPVLLLGCHGPGGFALEVLPPTALLPAVFGALAEAGLTPVGEQAYDTLRIEEGLPAMGREAGDGTNPLEAGLWDSVSFTKGCYVGQEVVARLKTYGKVKRTVTGLSFPASLDPADAGDVFWDLLRVGQITSVARSRRLGRTIALALVKADYTQPGTDVYTVKESEKFEGKVVELPFQPES